MATQRWKSTSSTRRCASGALALGLMIVAALSLASCSAPPPTPASVTLEPTTSGEVSAVVAFEVSSPAYYLQIHLTSNTGKAIGMRWYGHGSGAVSANSPVTTTVVDNGPAGPWSYAADVSPDPTIGFPTDRVVLRLTTTSDTPVPLTFEVRGVTSSLFPAGTVTQYSPLGADCDLAPGHTDLRAVDLSGRDLTFCAMPGVTLDPAKLTGTDLSGAQLGQSTIEPGVLDHTDLTAAELGGATMTGVDFTHGSTLHRVNLDDAVLDGANLQEVALGGTLLSGTHLALANLTGVSSGDVVGVPLLPPGWVMRGYGYLVHHTANLVGAGFAETDMSGLDLHGANLVNVNFESADLHDTDLTGANLTGARLTKHPLFAGVNLQGTDLAGATLTGVSSGGLTGTPASLPVGYTIDGGFLVGPGAELNGANLAGLDLHGRDLSGIRLLYVDLTGANLDGANLAGANVQDSKLINAHLEGTVLTGAHLGPGALSGQVDLTGSTGTPVYAGVDMRYAVCPDGTLGSAHGNTCQGHPWP